MKQQIYEHISLRAFFKIIAPSIVGMVFIALYSIVDGIFIARFVGDAALAAINLVIPICSATFAIGIMLSTGGSAVVSIKMGEKNMTDAREKFTFTILIGLASGAIMSLLCILLLKPLLIFLGATENLYPYCFSYALIICIGMPVAILKTLYEYFFRANGNPGIGLSMAVLGGVVNIFLDYLFIVHWSMGITGAALGTVMGFLMPAVIGTLFFTKKDSPLHFVKTKWQGKFLLEACINGSSEMVTELSTGFTTFLFNILCLKYMGEAGLSAITIILYAHFLLTSVYLGFASGIAPAVSYNYGAENSVQIKQMMKYSVWFLIISSVLVFVCSLASAPYLIGIFTAPHSGVFDIALRGLKIFSVGFLFIGINIFASALFTAFSNGKISALISMLRVLVFVSAGLLLLPLLFNSDGIWLTIPLAELLSLGVSLYYLKRYSYTYGYNLRQQT